MYWKALKVIVVLLITSVYSTAQVNNFVLDSITSGQLAMLPSVAINPKYPDNIVISFGDGGFFYTKDSGKRWSKSSISSTNPPINAIVLSEPKGNFRAFLNIPKDGEEAVFNEKSSSSLVIYESYDGGTGWTMGEPIDLGSARPIFPAVSSDVKGNVHLAWSSLLENSSDSAIDMSLFLSSSRNLKKWNDPSLIARHRMSRDRSLSLPAGHPAASFDGKLFIAWAFDGKLYLDRAFDGGSLWLTNDIPVATLTSPKNRQGKTMVTLESDKSKSPFRGSLYLMWPDVDAKGATSIMFSRSQNFGDNWSSPARIGGHFDPNFQSVPAMAIDQDNGAIVITFYDQENEQDEGALVLAYSVDGGASFKTIRINEQPIRPVATKANMGLSATKGTIVVAWATTRTTSTHFRTAILKLADLK